MTVIIKCYQETSPRWQVHNTCGIPHEKQHIGTGESSRHVVTAEVQGTGNTAGSQTGAVPAWHTQQHRAGMWGIQVCDMNSVVMNSSGGWAVERVLQSFIHSV